MQKPFLVIIPGWEGNKKTWEKFINISNQEFDTFCLDLPCFGEEPCPKKIWGVEDYAEYVKTKIINYELPINLLGHSFGGQIAVLLTAKYPELVDKLILSGASVYRQKNSLKTKFFGLIAIFGKVVFKLSIINFLKEPAKKILYKLADSPDYINTNGIKRDIFKKIIREDVSNLLEKIKIPTLIVWGEKDNYVSIKFGKKIAEQIKNSNFVTIPNGRHGLHLQFPDELLKLIKSFINKKS